MLKIPFNLFSSFVELEEQQASLVKLKGVLFSLFVFFLVVIPFASWHYYQQDSKEMIYSMERQLPIKLGVAANDLALRVTHVIQDVQLLASLHEDFMTQHNGKALANSAHVMRNMMEANRYYAQIRLVDMKGYELIRIEQQDNQVVQIPTSKLQDKSQRYYFIEGAQLNSSEIYISPIDLNVEHGKIEEPYRPMMRFIAPVFDKNKQRKALIIINYDANSLLALLDQFKDSDFEVSLLNNKGYWLKSNQPENEWGFMFEDKRSLTFANRYPDLWKSIAENPTGSAVLDSGFYSFTTINFADVVTQFIHSSKELDFAASLEANNTWKLVYFLNQEKISHDLTSLQTRYLLATALIILLILASSVYFFRFIEFRSKHNKMLLKQAYFDDLTLVHNRTALAEIGENFYEDQIDFTLLYIDLDSFKPVNDKFGHHVGDEVLRMFTQRTLKLLRENDILFRLGGDEFVVLLKGTLAKRVAEDMSRRIQKEIEKVFRIGDIRLHIGLSCGISYSKDFDNLQDALKQADKSMYLVKHSKTRLTVEPWLIS